MSLWSYPTLNEFKNSRLGEKIVSFTDLRKEINLTYNGNEEHMWIIGKEKKDFLLKNEHIINLPLKIKETELIRDNQKIYHFISKCSHVGFNAEKHFSFREMVDTFFDVKHNNMEHFTLLKIMAFGAYISRINARLCSNTEFGKDSTFEVLNYLTNSVAVFDKPRTMAKLEYGVVNSVLMVNELVPKAEEERRIISEFLLSIGSMKPIYQKTSRGSAGFGTKDSYDITNLSLIICYNCLTDVSEADKEHYFDTIFGKNILERYIPFKMNGRLDVDQFVHSNNYTADVDTLFMKMARTIEWYKLHHTEEMKPFEVNLKNIKLAGRQKASFKKICDFLNLYAKDEIEFNRMVNSLLQCHYEYLRMLNGSQLLTEFQEDAKITTRDTRKDDEIVPIGDVEEVKDDVISFLRKQKNGEYDTGKLCDRFGDAIVKKHIANADIFETPQHKMKLLE